MVPSSLSLKLARLVLAASSVIVAQAAPLRVATLNVKLGLEAPGTMGHEAVADILARIDADVVALQELQPSDLSGDPSSLQRLAAFLDLPHIHVAGIRNVLDSFSRTAILSRHPITSTNNIASPTGANDMVRQVPVIVVDVPGTEADPTILTLHLKCCLDLDDPFRRAIELHRVGSYLQSAGLTASDHIIIMGDFNLIGSDLTYQSLPATLPPSYLLGEDVSFPVNYFQAPDAYLRPWSMTPLDARQLNGSTNTQGSSLLDYILASPPLIDPPPRSEIYNSNLDTGNGQGLSKTGSPLPPTTSAAASDHLAVFADFELADQPTLDDSDGDGLPDSLEALLGTDPLLPDSDGNGTPDGDEDADEDLQSNLAEFAVTLTNPLDAHSRFEITVSPHPVPGNVLVAIPTILSRVYTICRSHDLTNWVPLSTIPGTGGEETLVVPGDATKQSNFYRVEISRN